MNPSAPHVVTMIESWNELYKKTLACSGAKTFISRQIDPICFQVLQMSITIT